MKMTRQQKDFEMFKINLSRSPRKAWLMSLYDGAEHERARFWIMVSRMGIKR